MITTEDIKHIAKLSKLEFSENEIENFKEELGQIVEYVNTLSKIDTSSVNLENEAINLNNLREDNPNNSLSQEEAIKNAPKKRACGFNVPAVIE